MEIAFESNRHFHAVEAPSTGNIIELTVGFGDRVKVAMVRIP